MLDFDSVVILSDVYYQSITWMSFPNIFQAKKWQDLDGAKQLWRHNYLTTTHQRHIFSTRLDKRNNATYTIRIRASEALRKASALARRNRRKAQTARRRVRTTAALLALHFERPTPGPTNHANQVCATWICGFCATCPLVWFFSRRAINLGRSPYGDGSTWQYFALTSWDQNRKLQKHMKP